MSYILKGTTEKCLVHFRDAPFSGDKKAVLAKFCRVNAASTVRRWLSKGQTKLRPVGVTLIRLRYYLELLGYEVSELSKLSKPLYIAGGLVAFGLVEIDELVTQFEIPGGRGGRCQLLAVWHGEQGMSPERLKKVAAYVAAGKFEQLLAEARQQTPRLEYRGEKLSAIRPAAPVQPMPAPTVARQRQNSEDPIVGSLADLIKAMTPLARAVASNAYSAEDRNRLRELTGKGVIFEASNLLSSLCSETALGLNSAKNK